MCQIENLMLVPLPEYEEKSEKDIELELEYLDFKLDQYLGK